MIATRLLLFTSCLCAFVCTISADTVPVLMWTNFKDEAQVKSIPTLAVRTEESFQKQIAELTNDFALKTIVLSADTLRIEDLKNKIGGALCYEDIAQIPNKIYDPAVASPVQSLRRLNLSSVDVTVETNNELSKSIENEKIVFINVPFDVTVDTREQYDARLNRIAAALSDKFQSGKYLFIYTAKAGGHDKVLTRKARAASPSTKKFIKDANLLIFVEHVIIHKEKGHETVELVSATTSDVLESSLKATLKAGEASIVLNIISSAGSWAVVGATVNDEPSILFKSIAAPLGASYHCSPDLYIKAGEKEITGVSINGLQIQPTFKDQTAPEKFGWAIDCVGFSSAGIWSGLFVTFLLILILTIGISWIMDIRTMDRFDDPKGKTITVNMSE